MTGGAWMDEQGATAKRDEHTDGGAPGRTNTRWLLVVLGVLVIGAVAGYVIGAMNGDTGSDVADTPSAGVTDGSPAPSPGPVASTVATEGARLTSLPGPPAGTMAMLETATVAADAVYSVTFRPYGYGPGQGSGGLVILIEIAVPQNESAKAFDMSGRNVLVTVSSAAGAITQGGAYQGLLGFREQGGLLAPMLRDTQLVD